MTEIGGQGPMGAADPAPSPETVAGATGFGGYHTYGGSPLPGNKKPMRKKMAKGNVKPPSVKLPSLPHELSVRALRKKMSKGDSNLSGKTGSQWLGAIHQKGFNIGMSG